MTAEIPTARFHLDMAILLPDSQVLPEQDFDTHTATSLRKIRSTAARDRKNPFANGAMAHPNGATLSKGSSSMISSKRMGQLSQGQTSQKDARGLA